MTTQTALDLFRGAKFALLTDDEFCVPLPIFFDDGANDRPLQFTFKNRDQVHGWQLLSADDEVLDAGSLTKERSVHRGDRIIFRRGSIKSAAVGDILGITCVFMPSGFAVGVPSTGAVNPPGVIPNSFAYPEQEERAIPFWLPKRRWAYVPETPMQLSGWQKRLTLPDVGVRETVRRKQADLVMAGVL